MFVGVAATCDPFRIILSEKNYELRGFVRNQTLANLTMPLIYCRQTPQERDRVQGRRDARLRHGLPRPAEPPPAVVTTSPKRLRLKTNLEWSRLARNLVRFPLIFQNTSMYLENRYVFIGSGNSAAPFLRLLLATNKTAFLTALRYEALLSHRGSFSSV